MRASDIKVGCIYNVIFDPVRDCEFDGRHLAVVLKKNNDRSTFIVMPLTSASNGNGINKVHIGQIPSTVSACHKRIGVLCRSRLQNIYIKDCV